MKRTFKKIAQGVLLLPVMLLGVTLFVPAVSAADECELTIQGGADCAKGNGQDKKLFGGDDSIFKSVTNILLFLVGAISVIMLIVGGIRYVISGGDQAQVTSAKNTILYAIVGIVIAFLAYAAVSFVTTSLGTSA